MRNPFADQQHTGAALQTLPALTRLTAPTTPKPQDEAERVEKASRSVADHEKKDGAVKAALESVLHKTVRSVKRAKGANPLACKKKVVKEQLGREGTGEKKRRRQKKGGKGGEGGGP